MNPNHPARTIALICVCALASITAIPIRAQLAQTTTTTTTTTSSTTSDQETPVKLSPFEVNASSNTGYGATNTSTASRVAQAYIDVPQTLNVFTSEYMNDLNIIDERALLQNVPNLLLGFDVFNSRIIRASQVNATYLDGLSQQVTTQGPPIDFYDRVEIVKGPSSAGFGVGEPGGIINYVSKTPQDVDKTTIHIGFGDYDNYKFSIDTQGVSTKYAGLSYRVDAFYDQGNYKIPVWYHSGSGLELALKYELDRNTTVQLITAYSNVLTPADNNLAAIWEQATLYTVWRSLTGDAYPALPNTPKNPGNSVQDWAAGATLLPNDYNPNPPWGGFDTKNFTAELFVDHAFDEHLHLRNSFETQSVEWTYKFSEISSLRSNPTGYPPGLYTDIARTYFDSNSHGIVDDLDFLADYNFGKWIDSRTLVGVVYGQNNGTSQQYQPAQVDAQGNFFIQNVYNPSRAPMGDPPGQRLQEGDNQQRSFGGGWYVQEDLSLFDDHLVLSASRREDYQDFYSINFLNQTSGYTGGWKNTKQVPRYAVTFKPTKWLSVYELYAVHHDPVQTAEKYFIVLGTPTPAQYAQYGNFATLEDYNPGGVLVESGVKGTFFGGRLTFSFDFFHEINSGQVFGRVVEADYNSSGQQTLQIGTNLISGVNAHGYEWEIFGQPTKRLTFIINYGQTKGHYPAFADGMPHWWGQAPGLFGHGKYDFGDLHGKGFYVTFGGQYFWGYWNYQDPYVWQRAGQYTVDGGVGYKWDHGRQSLYMNVNNFTNQLVVVGNEDNVPWTVLPHEQGYVTYSLSF